MTHRPRSSNLDRPMLYRSIERPESSELAWPERDGQCRGVHGRRSPRALFIWGQDEAPPADVQNLLPPHPAYETNQEAERWRSPAPSSGVPLPSRAPGPFVIPAAVPPPVRRPRDSGGERGFRLRLVGSQAAEGGERFPARDTSSTTRRRCGAARGGERRRRRGRSW